jgi:formate-dependent nitrite reductase membrane component NrfD
VCPTQAILVGDMNDPTTRVAQLVQRDAVTVRRPEKETHPKLFYRGAHQTTLDPLAARRPEGGLFMWSEQGRLPNQVTSGHSAGWNNSAAAVLSYDIPHRAPWDWRVSLYTWTKSIAAGVYLVALLAVTTGSLPQTDALWQTVTPAIAMFALAVTGLILILDLEHPLRFYLIFTQPQWRSWLVRGAFVIAAYALLLLVHVWLEFGVRPGGARTLAWLAAPAALMTAAYTAYLFAQAKARDLWQNPLAPLHLVVQAIIAGAAVLLITSVARDGDHVPVFSRLLAIACGLHLLLVLGEHTLTHVTAHARLAAHEMTRGNYAVWFWTSCVLIALAGVASWWLPHDGNFIAPALAALVGLFAYEHANVQSAQAVPLA